MKSLAFVLQLNEIQLTMLLAGKKTEHLLWMMKTLMSVLLVREVMHTYIIPANIYFSNLFKIETLERGVKNNDF